MIITGSKIFGANGAEYEVLDFIGSGSFGSVYKVKEQTTDNVFALKTLLKPAEQNDLATFINEGMLALTINDPNVLTYHFFHDGSMYRDLPPYILMEFADGGTLEDLLQNAQRNSKAFSVTELRGMFKQLLSGMAAVNSKLIHRDIKPANVLLSGAVLKIGDFGLAKLVAEATRTFTFKGWGSYPYIAPEGWRFEKNTIQLDIYAMGIVFYQLATLRLPFDLNTADPQKWMEAHLYKAVPSPDKLNASIGPKLSHVIMKMIEKDASKRFADWPTITQLLEAEEPSSDTQKNYIQQMLGKRLQQDTAAQEAAASKRKEEKDRLDFCNIVTFQAEQAIIEPIRSLLDDFNKHYPGDKATMMHTSYEMAVERHYEVRLPSNKCIVIDFDVLLPGNFVRQIKYNDYGRERIRTEIFCYLRKPGRFMENGLCL